jgi:hypothetical protein
VISNHSNHGETRVYTKGQALTKEGYMPFKKKKGHMANYSVIATNILFSKTAGFLSPLDLWTLDKRYDSIISRFV